MGITKYTLARPDSDGDCSIDLEFEVQNATDEDVMLIKHEAFHFTTSGFLISSDVRNSSDCFLENGDIEAITGWGRIHERFLKADKSAKVHIQARLFKREFFKCGPFSVPESDSVDYIKAKVESSTVQSEMNFTLFRLPPDDDGEARIEVMLAITNNTDIFLESPELKVILSDRTGAEMESTSSSNDLPPRATTNLDPAFWGLKTKKLKGATIEFHLTVFQQVGIVNIEGTTKLEE